MSPAPTRRAAGGDGVARLVVTPCVTCGAPLEPGSPGDAEVRCRFCGTAHPAERPAQAPARAPDGPNVGVVLGSLLGGLALFVGGAFLLGWWLESDDADRVVSLEAVEALVAERSTYATRAAMTPDGSLWVACRHDRLCALDPSDRFLGSVDLPQVPHEERERAREEGSLRYDPVRAMAVDRRGRLYVAYADRFLEIASAERRLVGPVHALAPGEAPRCLAVGPDDALWVMTNTDDLVVLDANRTERARWRQPVLRHDPRHHGCDSLVVEPSGQVWVTPVAAPAVYVFSPEGQLVRRHSPGGGGHYTGLAVLPEGRAAVGYYTWVVLFGPDFVELEGPRTSRRRGWAEVSDLLRSPDDALVVTTTLGVIARWRRASERW